MPQAKTRALMADLAAVLRLPGMPPDDDNGYRLTIGADVTVLLYGEADTTLLAIAPLGPLPPGAGYGLTAYLLGRNMFNGDLTPFQVALDGGGGVILWGRLALAGLDGQRLAGVLNILSDRAAEIGAELAAAR